MSVFSTKYGNDYGLATAITYSITHFILRRHRVEDYSKEILYNLGTALFCLLCLYTLVGSCFNSAPGCPPCLFTRSVCKL